MIPSPTSYEALSLGHIRVRVEIFLTCLTNLPHTSLRFATTHLLVLDDVEQIRVRLLERLVQSLRPLRTTS